MRVSSASQVIARTPELGHAAGKPQPVRSAAQSTDEVPHNDSADADARPSPTAGFAPIVGRSTCPRPSSPTIPETSRLARRTFDDRGSGLSRVVLSISVRLA